MTTLLRTMAVLLAAVLVAVLSGCCPLLCGNCPKEEVVKETGLTVNLVAQCKVDPFDVRPSRSADKINHIRWHNQTDAEQTVHFNAAVWPFVETHQDVVIEAGGYSAWFTVAPAGQNDLKFYYKVNPLIDGSCPPDEPSVTTDP